MADTGRFWNRVQEECRTVAARTSVRAKRAVRQGVLQVDLVSLRRDRGRALADLGERLLRLWTEGRVAAVEQDQEALRLKGVVESIEKDITAKEAEAAELHRPPEGSAPGATAEVVDPK